MEFLIKIIEVLSSLNTLCNTFERFSKVIDWFKNTCANNNNYQKGNDSISSIFFSNIVIGINAIVESKNGSSKYFFALSYLS